MAHARYQQIADRLRDQISAGVYGPGERLPSEPDLVGEYQASRNTVRLAIALLTNQGLVVTRQGLGTFVQQPTSVVAGKRAPRPVRAAQARREAYNQQFGSGIAEGRNRAIEPFRVGPPLSLPESRKARAERTVSRRLNLRGRSGQASSTGSVRARLTSSRI